MGAEAGFVVGVEPGDAVLGGDADFPGRRDHRAHFQAQFLGQFLHLLALGLGGFAVVVRHGFLPPLDVLPVPGEPGGFDVDVAVGEFCVDGTAGGFGDGGAVGAGKVGGAVAVAVADAAAAVIG